LVVLKYSIKTVVCNMQLILQKLITYYKFTTNCTNNYIYSKKKLHLRGKRRYWQFQYRKYHVQLTFLILHRISWNLVWCLMTPILSNPENLNINNRTVLNFVNIYASPLTKNVWNKLIFNIFILSIQYHLTIL
jgi:hypothetical protein